MGRASEFTPARLVVGLLSSPRAESPSTLVAQLEARLGRAEALGPELEFTWSDYYDREMGGRPRRAFLAFERLVDPAELAAIKTWTNEVEVSRSSVGGRLYNLDPGLLSLERFVLATTKERPQRIALSAGIYAELCLLYERGDYRPLPWTYPDWASDAYRALLRGLREGLKSDLRTLLP